jgi:hypothetical protein
MLMGERTRGYQEIALSFLLLVTGCGEPDREDAAAQGQLSAALSSSAFSNTSGLCPATTKWGAWAQTSLSTWDHDVQPVVRWIIDRTGISSSTYSGHSPSIGRASDWRPHSREEGTQLANWFLANTKSGGTPLGIDYIIWQAQIYLLSSGVKPMEDRGSFTQNHCDHIHISFVKSGSIHFNAASATAWGNVKPSDAGPSSDRNGKLSSPVDPDASEHPAGNDAGVSPPTGTSDDLGAASPASPAQPASPSLDLVGGCSFIPWVASGQTNALWLFLLLALGALLPRHR